MTTKDLVKKVLKGAFGIGTGLFLGANISNAQELPKDNIKWEKDNKYLTVESNNPLTGLSKYRQESNAGYTALGEPQSLENSYIIPLDSIKGNVSSYLRQIDVCEECCETETSEQIKIKKQKIKKGIKTWNDKFDNINNQYNETNIRIDILNEKTNDITSKLDSLNNTKKTQSPNSGNTYIFDNHTENHFYDNSKEQDTIPIQTTTNYKLPTKHTPLTTLGLSASTNPLKKLSGSISFEPQITDKVFLGAYIQGNLGAITTETNSQIHIEETLNEKINLKAITTGINTNASKTIAPFGFGASASLRHNKFLFNAKAGTVRTITENNSTSNGVTQIKQGNFVVDEKAFCIEDNNKTKDWGFTGSASANYELGSGWHAGLEGQVSSVKGNNGVALTIKKTFGGKNKK